ncbi:hypothetical protein ACEPAI_2152 [Sanghuangporus weigelae]
MSNNTSYDKALLDEAPEVTPQQRQRFYDADLLNDDRQRDGGALPAGAAAPIGARSDTDLEAGVVHGARSKEYTQLPPSSTAIRSSTKTPWYKSRKGIIGLVILAIVIIGAVVGGAVGGTVGKDDDNNSDHSVSTVPPVISPTSSSAEQGSGTAPIASPSPTPTTATQEAPIGSGTTSPEATPTPDPGQQGVSDAVAVSDDTQTAV